MLALALTAELEGYDISSQMFLNPWLTGGIE
jgi:hypothetical protein